MTRIYEIILQKQQLSCKGIVHDLRIYGWLIVDLMIWSSFFFAVFLFWFMYSAIMKVVRYFWDRNILWAKFPTYFRKNWRFITQDFRKVLCFSYQSLVRELDYC